MKHVDLFTSGDANTHTLRFGRLRMEFPPTQAEYTQGCFNTSYGNIWGGGDDGPVPHTATTSCRLVMRPLPSAQKKQTSPYETPEPPPELQMVRIVPPVTYCLLCCSAVVWMEEECDDRPYPQEVALSQTCWEYKTFLHQQSRATRQQKDVAVGEILSSIDHRQRQHRHHHQGQASEEDARRPPGQPPKRHKPSAPVNKRHQSQSPRAKAGRSATTITSIQTLRRSGSTQHDDMLRDLFVLVLQSSGLQKITSRAGFDVDFGTLLVADPSSAFLRVTLWRNAARVGARLIRAGDLVRLNRSGSVKAAEAEQLKSHVFT